MLEIMPLITFVLQVNNIIYGNSTIPNVTNIGALYQYMNAGTGGLMAWILLVVLYVIFMLVMILRDVDVTVASLVSSIITLLISLLAIGAFNTSAFAPFLFGGIAIVSFLMVVFRGAEKSY